MCIKERLLYRLERVCEVLCLMFNLVICVHNVRGPMFRILCKGLGLKIQIFIYINSICLCDIEEKCSSLPL